MLIQDDVVVDVQYSSAMVQYSRPCELPEAVVVEQCLQLALQDVGHDDDGGDGGDDDALKVVRS